MIAFQRGAAGRFTLFKFDPNADKQVSSYATTSEGNVMTEAIDWTEADVLSLIANQVQESLTLDYKRFDALAKTDPKKIEISKDVSAFANSAGGVILYGVDEDKNYPTRIDGGLDPTEISKEWIEQVINSSVHPKIEGLIMNQTSLSSSVTGRVLYAVHIPAGTSCAPHQAKDKR